MELLPLVINVTKTSVLAGEGSAQFPGIRHLPNSGNGVKY
jgi:hypothetical protein